MKRGLRYSLGTYLITVFVATGCGTTDNQSSATGDEYPLVDPPSGYQPPREYELAPGSSCERIVAASPQCPKTLVIPPTPGLRATALSAREIRLEWSFNDLPDDCRPALVLLAVNADTDTRATPTTTEVAVSERSGNTKITYPDFLPPPDAARAAAYTSDGLSSRTVSVLIGSG